MITVSSGRKLSENTEADNRTHTPRVLVVIVVFCLRWYTGSSVGNLLETWTPVFGKLNSQFGNISKKRAMFKVLNNLITNKIATNLGYSSISISIEWDELVKRKPTNLTSFLGWARQINHIDYSYSFTYPLLFFYTKHRWALSLSGHISTISRNYEIGYIKEIFYKIVILPFLPNEVPFIELHVWRQQNLQPCTLMADVQWKIIK